MSCDTLKEINAFKCSQNAIQTYNGINSDDLYQKYSLATNSYSSKPFIQEEGINLIMNNCNIYPYTVCINGNNANYYHNCALSTKNPWFSLNKITEKCSPNIEALSKSLITTKDSKDIIKFQSPYISELQNAPPESYCEDRWYDWFTIPYFHLGNSYSPSYKQKDTNNIIIDKCYKPCSYPNIPVIDNNINVCTIYSSAYNGLFMNSFRFTPLAILNLLSTNIYDSLLLHYNTYQIDKIYNSNIYNIDEDVDKAFYINYKNDKFLYNNLNNLPSFIINNNQFNIYNQLISGHYDGLYFNNFDDFSTGGILNLLNFYLNDIHYDSSSFTIPDDNVIKSMYNHNLFKLPILQLTYNMSKRFYDNHNNYLYNKNDSNHYNNIINSSLSQLILSGTIYTINKKLTLNSINNDPLFIDITLNANDEIEFNKFKRLPIEFIIYTILSSSLIDKYNIKDKINYDTVRLASIFRKATNICFDNKTPFSKYIFNVLNDSINYPPFSYANIKITDEYQYIQYIQPRDTNSVNDINNNVDNSNNKELAFKNSKLYDFQTIIHILIYILLGLFIIYISYIIWILFRPYIIKMLNWGYEMYDYIGIMYIQNYTEEEKEYQLTLRNYEIAKNQKEKVYNTIEKINKKKSKRS